MDRSESAAGSAATREQLLAAAAEVFAESGFREATVRDICRRAGANGASVNYHFGGKEELYREVLRRNFRLALHRFPPDGGVPPTAPVEARLEGFIRSFLSRIIVTGPDACHGRMLARELVDPTPALDSLIAHEVRALAEYLGGLVAELLGKGADSRAIRLGIASVVSQIVFYQHCRPVIQRLFPDLQFNESNLGELAAHVTRFSLAGLAAMAASLSRPSAETPVRRTRRPSPR